MTETTETMSVRRNPDNYEFSTAITKVEQSDLSKAARDRIARGRILLEVENRGRAKALSGQGGNSGSR
jgi:hypothetical protein